MSKNLEIENLLQNKIQERPVVFDGIVDENKFYKEGNQKFLFLLKDVNGTMSSEKSIDYERNPSFISITRTRAEGQKEEPQNWKPLCYWTEAFKHPEKSFIAAEKCGSNLLEIAIANLKKTPGKGVADRKELMEAAKKYGAILKKEIEIISPSVVICGGTYSYAKMIYKKHDDFGAEHTMKCGSKYFVSKSGLRFVDFVHPSVRVTLAATFAYAKEVGKELGLDK